MAPTKTSGITVSHVIAGLSTVAGIAALVLGAVDTSLLSSLREIIAGVGSVLVIDSGHQSWLLVAKRAVTAIESGLNNPPTTGGTNAG